MSDKEEGKMNIMPVDWKIPPNPDITSWEPKPISFEDDIKKPSQWISVKDRLPEEGVGVLVYWDSPYKNKVSIMERHPMTVDLGEDEPYIFEGAFSDSGGWLADEVTHWQPLPELPEGE